jgi:2Fe-2S ferredoxin
MPKVTFLEMDGDQREIEVVAGTTVLEAARAHDLPITGTCGGSMVCATCHVMIAAADRAKLPPPSEDEEDTLDLAFGVTAVRGWDARSVDRRRRWHLHPADLDDAHCLKTTS